jgi:hypothetical protein
VKCPDTVPSWLSCRVRRVRARVGLLVAEDRVLVGVDGRGVGLERGDRPAGDPAQGARGHGLGLGQERPLDRGALLGRHGRRELPLGAQDHLRVPGRDPALAEGSSGGRVPRETDGQADLPLRFATVGVHELRRPLTVLAAPARRAVWDLSAAASSSSSSSMPRVQSNIRSNVGPNRHLGEMWTIRTRATAASSKSWRARSKHARESGAGLADRHVRSTAPEPKAFGLNGRTCLSGTPAAPPARPAMCAAARLRPRQRSVWVRLSE